MQTFLPFADFRASAEVLDNKRLGKQRVETLQVMKALTIEGYGWQHHPVVAMWRGFRPALMVYQDAVCSVWTERGFADTCLVKTFAILEMVPEDAAEYLSGSIRMPPWLGREDVHESHRSRLIAKSPEFYEAVFPGAPRDIDYVWPTTAPSPE